MQTCLEMCGPGCTGTSSSPRCKGTSSGSGCTGTSSSPRCTGTSCGTKGKGTSRSWVLQYIRSCWITLAVFAFGATIRGEWLLIGIHVLRQFGMLDTEGGPSSPEPAWSGASLGPIRLQNLPTFWLIANGVGFAIYFLVGGFLHWHFYVKQRDKPEDWKCQATKWLSADLERAEIVFGSFSLMVVNTFTSILACHIANGGYSTVYYKYDQFSWSWYFAQWPVIFCYQDYTTYWLHRWYHTPWLYKKFHKAHHRYVQPTAFSVTAIHPVEIVHIQLTLCLPMFTIPTHWTSFTAIALYTYYNGIIDHSGVDFKAPRWQPWRPDTIFHDNHHQYFHVNFGFNCYFWDIIHGTYRKADRIYKEDIFYGKGKPFCEASIEELKDEISQRRIENPRAHRTFNPLLNQEEVLQDLKHLNQGLCR